MKFSYKSPSFQSSIVQLRGGTVLEVRRGNLTGNALPDKRTWPSVKAWKQTLPNPNAIFNRDGLCQETDPVPIPQRTRVMTVTKLHPPVVHHRKLTREEVTELIDDDDTASDPRIYEVLRVLSTHTPTDLMEIFRIRVWVHEKYNNFQTYKRTHGTLSPREEESMAMAKTLLDRLRV